MKNMTKPKTATLRLALCQMASSESFANNIAAAESCLRESQGSECDVVIFPENTLCRGSHQQIRDSTLTDLVIRERLGALSATYGMYTVWGGIAVRYDKQLYNVAMVFDRNGACIQTYRKIHLFKYVGSKGNHVDESTLYEAGEQPASFTADEWSIGLTICYDLRFPELFRAYHGAHLVICAADFTHFTGRAHWDVLLRARAIENQCYIAGVNQCGYCPSQHARAYGHSLLVDPWGRRLAEAEETPVCLHCDIDLETIDRVRNKLPVLDAVRHHHPWP